MAKHNWRIYIKGGFAGFVENVSYSDLAASIYAAGRRCRVACEPSALNANTGAVEIY